MNRSDEIYEGEGVLGQSEFMETLEAGRERVSSVNT